MNKEKIIIFDLNGVLINFSIYMLLKHFLSYKQKTNLIICFADPRVIYKTIQLLLKEKVVEKAALDLIKSYPKLQKHSCFILNGINCQKIKPGVLDLLENLKKNNKLFIFSNIGEVSIEILKNKYSELFNNFTNIFYAKESENYLCKPNKLAFEKVKSNLNTNKEIIFIDDKTENLKIADFFNFKPIKFKSIKQLKNSLLLKI